MTGDTARRLRRVFDSLDWQSLLENHGQRLLENSEELGKLFSKVLSGEIKFNPHLMVITHQGGRIDLESKSPVVKI